MSFLYLLLLSLVTRLSFSDHHDDVDTGGVEVGTEDGDGGATACDAGQYLLDELCVECPVDTWSGGGAEECVPCPQGKGAPVATVKEEDCTWIDNDNRVWPECRTAAADKTSSNPKCDPCSPRVYTEYNNRGNTMIYTAYTTPIHNYMLEGWIRFTMGTGMVTEHCPLQYTCGGDYPVWMRGTHPAREERIQPRQMCVHYTNGDCCTYTEDVHVKNCGSYYVYRLTYNLPISSSYYSPYCVDPKPEDIPNICDDPTYTLLEDDTARGELVTGTGSGTEPVNIGNDNDWYTFLAGKGTIKQSCPGINHCGFQYPMWVDGDYPTSEGEIVRMMGHAATSSTDICTISNSQPVYVVKCVDKFYHKFDKVVTYSGFCINDDIEHLCDGAYDLVEGWRGTTIEKKRDHCDTNGITDFDDWYRILVHQKKMPDHCVAPNKCGADNGYYVEGGHPAPGDGIVGRYFYYSTASDCHSSSVTGLILNCGDEDGEDDFIYRWTQPSGCDKVFCAEENPCSGTVYKRLEEEGRAGRTFTRETVNDNNLEHGWYRFTKGEGVMSRTATLPGHSGISYPGWFDGEYPEVDGEEYTGRACFVSSSNDCSQEREVTIKKCKGFYVYHLKTTSSSYGYTYEEDICKRDTLKLDNEWRLQYNLDTVAGSDNKLATGWYEVTIGKKMLTNEPCLYKHGGSGKYCGWMAGEHPTEEEGIVQRTVYFTTADTTPQGSNTDVYVRNCGSRYLYYLTPHSANYYYSIAQELCQSGSYEEVNQDNRLYSNPTDLNNNQNNDNKYFVTFTKWYRFMNGNQRLAEWPKIQDNYHGGFLYPYQFPEGCHAAVPDGGMSEPIKMENYHGPGSEHDLSWPWYIQIKRCEDYWLYKIPPLSSSYTRAGVVVEDEDDSVCNEERYIELSDMSRLVSSTIAAPRNHVIPLSWYRLTAGLGYMPTNKFVGTQCSATYHGHLKYNHQERQEIQRNEVEFYSTNPDSVSGTRMVWVMKCEDYYLYRLRDTPGTNYHYCEASDGCKHARVVEGEWRINSKAIATGMYESSYFGNDGWVFFTQGLEKIPVAPPPRSVGGCTYNGYIDSHPLEEDGAVSRDMMFPGVDKVEPILVQNCGDGYVYFLSSSIANDYCYVADTDVCEEGVYTAVDDHRRLHYSHKYGTSYSRFDLDNKFNGWIRYTVGEEMMMEEPPVITGMCTTDYQGWLNGEHPSVEEGEVKREVCWRYDLDDCYESNDISIKNCGDFYVYGISTPPPSNQYGHCIEQDKDDVCEGAKQLDNWRRGMLTETREYVNDQLKIVEDGYYRFMSGLGRLTSFPVYEENCGGTNRVLIKSVIEKDEESGDALFELQEFYTSGWTGTVYRNLGLQCEDYWIYQLFNIDTAKLAYCVEEEVCDSLDIKMLHSGINLQWLKYSAGSKFHELSTGWYQVMVGEERLSHTPPDTDDCGAIYSGYVTTHPPSRSDGIVPGEVCYRTSDSSAATASCQDIYMKMCTDKPLYYLSASPSSNYAMCLDTDVCDEVDGEPLDDLWRLRGTPKEAGGYDDMEITWYKVTIGLGRLAVNMEEADCGTTYSGYMNLGRHPSEDEGTVDTEICYNTGGEVGDKCKPAKVVNCGTHYLYHLRPCASSYGLCVASDGRSMCGNYKTLDQSWRSEQYSATVDKSDIALQADWYRFTTGSGMMASHCPSYAHGGGYYPSYAYDLEGIPDEDEGVVSFEIYWRYTGTTCTWISKTGYVRNCGEYPVYWLPKQTNSYTTYNVEVDVCSEDQYTVINDESRLAWRPTSEDVDPISDNNLESGWYRFDVGLKRINVECTPMNYGGTTYPGWMEAGHPDIGEIQDSTVYFRVNTNCMYTSKAIRVKNCGEFFVYELPPTSASYGYTIASEPCDVRSRFMEEEYRSIYNRDTAHLDDSGLIEGWYQFTKGLGVMPKSPPAPEACRSKYPTWLDGDDPSEGEGVVIRTICSVNGDDTCSSSKEIKVRNCGNSKILYYFTASPPHSQSGYCVDDTMKAVCTAAVPLDDVWRGITIPGTGRTDRVLAEGWYKFTKHAKRLANYPTTTSMCGSTYPLWMYGEHAQLGKCVLRTLYQVHARTYPNWRSGPIYECLCSAGYYIYYHIPTYAPMTSYEGTYCVEEDPCDNAEFIINTLRSPWIKGTADRTDADKNPRWVELMSDAPGSSFGVMPTYVPEEGSCGASFPGWYDGEIPTEVGQMTVGRSCFVVSGTPCSTSYLKETRVMMCPGGHLIYHWLPSYDYRFAYCIDEDVCDVATEDWGRADEYRLRHTSTSGYLSGTRLSDNTLTINWYKIHIGLKRLPTECVGYMSCGTLYPGWMQGEHPAVGEGIVDRTICYTDASDCCSKTTTIKVVGCSKAGKPYYLYRLYATASSYGYCIDESSDDVCSIQEDSLQHITDIRHGTGQYYDGNYKADYVKYPVPGWSLVDVHSRHFVHYPPAQYFCGVYYPGWVEDPPPGPDEGVVSSRACFRDSMSNVNCYQPMPFKMKNCDGEMRYLYAAPVIANRAMCVEQDVCQPDNYEILEDEVWRMAYTTHEDEDHHTDYRKIHEDPYRGWIRFTGVGFNILPTIQQEYLSCGVQYPVWMGGKHPTAEEGVSPRTVYATSSSDYTWQSQTIHVKNCGDFVLYNIDFDWLAGYKWGLCVDINVCEAPVTELDNAHRLVNTWGRVASDDTSLPKAWYKFINGYEMMPEECPIAESCGSLSPGYLSQTHPSLREGILERKVCFGDADQCCVASTDVLVKNCGTHFVYRLYPTSTYQKYCVEDDPDTMCKEDEYQDIHDEWRGENVPYDDANNQDVIEPGWYRFTTDLGRMPEYSMAYLSCGMYYPGYMSGGPHPTRAMGVVNREVCYSTSATNEDQSCQNIRVKNCGKYYVYELVPTHSVNYGYCVAQDQCSKATELAERWRLVFNPTVSSQSNAADQSLRKGWYRLTHGYGIFPDYEPEQYYGGGTYPSYMVGDLPTVKEGEVSRTLKYSGSTSETHIRVLNCGEHYVYWLPASPASTYTYTIDGDICLHANPLDEFWRNQFYVPALDQDEVLHSDYGRGLDWYQFTTGFRMMSDRPPHPRYSCGTRYPAYMNQPHPLVEDGIDEKELCYKRDEDNEEFYQACLFYEDILVKNCGDYYVYLLNPTIEDAGYCTANRKTSCSPNVVHAKMGDSAVINCTLNSDKDFDSSEVVWTKLYSTELPDDSLSNMAISDDKLILNIADISQANIGVYSIYIPSTATSELVELILYNPIEAEQKYYVVNEGDEVTIEITVQVVPEPQPDKISWIKLPNKELTGPKFILSADKRSLNIKEVSSTEGGTYRCTVEFEIAGVRYTKYADIIVQVLPPPAPLCEKRSKRSNSKLARNRRGC